MNNILHQHLNQLRVIALFREGDKARIESGSLTVDPRPNYGIAWLRRQWWTPWGMLYSPPCKDETVRYLQQFYISICQLAEQILAELDADKRADERRRSRLIDAAQSLEKHLRESVDGLRALAKTYEEFPKQHSELTGIINDYAEPAIRMLNGVLPRQAPKLSTSASSILLQAPAAHLSETNSVRPSETNLVGGNANAVYMSEEEQDNEMMRTLLNRMDSVN
jgi:hypothetical protein